VEIAQGEAALHLLAPVLLEWMVDERVVTRRGNDDVTYAPHGVYPAAGSEWWVAIVCQNDVLWRALAEIVARHVDRDRDPHDIQDRLRSAGVAAHDVQNSTQCVADPQLAHRQHFRRVPHPVHGATFVDGPNAASSRTPPYPAWAGPTIGQHTDEVLRDILGYDDEAITEVVIAGAVTSVRRCTRDTRTWSASLITGTPDAADICSRASAGHTTTHWRPSISSRVASA
jgi:benzylsuccinate CoA-transferase BbsF subunit